MLPLTTVVVADPFGNVSVRTDQTFEALANGFLGRLGALDCGGFFNAGSRNIALRTVGIVCWEAPLGHDIPRFLQTLGMSSDAALAALGRQARQGQAAPPR